MIIFLKLILAHMIGDFLLQPISWVRHKEKYKLRSVKLYLHILIHGALLLLLLWNWQYWPLALLLAMVHGLIDVGKLYFQNKNNKTKWFVFDQALHILCIALLYWIWFQPGWTPSNLLERDVIWLYATAIFFLTVVSGISIQNLMLKWSDELTSENGRSLKNAGTYIGILERIFVFIFVILGRWEAVGFLLTAKSIFRFGDLSKGNERKLTEYILIGTFLSFGIAILTALLVEYLNTHLSAPHI